MVLDNTQPLTTFRLHQARHMALSALEARLRAEEGGATRVNWRPVPRGSGRDEAIADQNAIFKARLETQDSWRKILNRRVAQLEQEIEGLTAQIDSATRQLALIEQEIVSVSELLSKGLARLPRLLALQRTQAEIEWRAWWPRATRRRHQVRRQERCDRGVTVRLRPHVREQ